MAMTKQNRALKAEFEKQAAIEQAERDVLRAAKNWAYGEIVHYDYEADLRKAVDDLIEARGL